MKPHAELDAAGITDPHLRTGYLHCRELLARHGRTYFLAAQLLAAPQRPAVYALYGFARWTDDIVDRMDGTTIAQRTEELDEVERLLAAAFRDPQVEKTHPIIAALTHTAHRYELDEALFAAFLAAMRMDLAVTEYATFADLRRYMRGSAEVIGLQMLPVLGTVVQSGEAETCAAALGTAFQLTNFLRDVGEDLDRGRVYLPRTELAAFGVDHERLSWCRRHGRADPQVRRALAHLVAWNRSVYRAAEPGIAMLRPASRPCIHAARRLYEGILDQIVAADYDVLGHRVVVPTTRRLALAAPAFAHAAVGRLRAGEKPWPPHDADRRPAAATRQHADVVTTAVGGPVARN